MPKRQVILELIAALLLILFVYASVSKLMDFKRFVGDINNQPFSNVYTPYLAYGLPAGELAIAAGLLMERTRLLAFWASAILLSIFTIYIIVILSHYYSYIPCSCGGLIRKLSWTQHLIFNLFFILVSVAGIALQYKKRLFKTTYITKNSFV